jgi:hypothetical protein
MRDYPRGFRNSFFRRCCLAVSDSLSITPALPVTSLFSYRRRPIVLLRLPLRPSPRRLPAFVTAIALSRPLRTKTPLASLQQTATRPRAPAGRLAGFPIFGRECRILVRAHGSVAPGSSCPGGDSHSPPGRSRFRFQRRLQSLSQTNPPPPVLLFLSPGRARLVGPHDRQRLRAPSLPSTCGALAPHGAAITAPSLGATDKSFRTALILGAMGKLAHNYRRP